jgi:hypothetical protein
MESAISIELELSTASIKTGLRLLVSLLIILGPRNKKKIIRKLRLLSAIRVYLNHAGNSCLALIV